MPVRESRWEICCTGMLKLRSFTWGFGKNCRQETNRGIRSCNSEFSDAEKYRPVGALVGVC